MFTTVVWEVVAITGLGFRHMLYMQQQGHTQQEMKIITKMTGIAMNDQMVYVLLLMLLLLKKQLFCSDVPICLKTLLQQYLF